MENLISLVIGEESCSTPDAVFIRLSFKIILRSLQNDFSSCEFTVFVHKNCTKLQIRFSIQQQ
jgi:hypothetical protein